MSAPNVPPPPAAPASSSNDKTLMLVLSYLSLLALIPILTEKDDANIQWHAKNGLVFFAAFVVAQVALTAISIAMPFGIGCGVWFISTAVWFAYVIVVILGIIKATQGQRLQLPGLSEFASKF